MPYPHLKLWFRSCGHTIEKDSFDEFYLDLEKDQIIISLDMIIYIYNTYNPCSCSYMDNEIPIRICIVKSIKAVNPYSLGGHIPPETMPIEVGSGLSQQKTSCGFQLHSYPGFQGGQTHKRFGDLQRYLIHTEAYLCSHEKIESDRISALRTLRKKLR